MSESDRQTHWQNIYTSKRATELSWFEETPRLSLKLIRDAGFGTEASIVDIGGGASRLVDALLSEGQQSVTVLDISAAALAIARDRLGKSTTHASWIVSDVTRWAPNRAYDAWHDRAMFHFLTEAADQAAYVAVMMAAVRVGGVAIIGTFAPDGPKMCSGLTVARYDAASLAEAFGATFALEAACRHEHKTPSGSIQRFQFSTFRRIDVSR